MRTRLLVLLTIGAGALGLATTSAQAWTLWAYKHGIQSGESVYGPKVNLVENLVEPQGVGIICAGIRFYGLYCPSTAETVTFTAGGVVNSEPYAHDHSTFQSGFSAWYR